MALLFTYLRGLAMGCADVVPGVSGGTIALLLGIYQRLVDAINAVTSLSPRDLAKPGGIPRYWAKIDGTFLLFLLAGIATAVLLLAKVVTYLIEKHPVLVWAFFFGLVLASVYVLARRIGKITTPLVIAFLIGATAGVLISTLAPVSFPEGWIYDLLAGAIAICAMILPGISGSFILVLLSRYTAIMEAVSALNLAIIIPFMIGALIGLLAFARLLSYLFKRFYNPTLALLTGFMGGSIVKIWPWRETNPTNPAIDSPVSLSRFAEINGGDSHLLPAIALIVLGALLVLFLSLREERIASKSTT